MSSSSSDACEVALHWRAADSGLEACSPARPVLVLIPDLALDGGVTHYYRTLRLDRLDNVDYFFVNRPGTRSRVEKSFHALGIFLNFIFRVRRYSLVHVNPSLNPNSFYRDWFFIAIAKLAGKPVLVFFRGWEADFEARVRDNPFLNRLFRWTYGRADRVITLGETFRHRLIELGMNRATPIQVDTTVASARGLDDLDVAARARAGRETMTCLFLSRVLREKGVFTAIDAVAECNGMLDRTAVCLVVAGTGPDLDAARRHAAERETACVEFVGEIRDDVKIEFLRRSQILLFPTSYGEGLPNSVLEAMLAGMVIVTRCAGAIGEIVEDGRNGLVSTSTDPATFSRYLARLVEDPALVAEIGERNRAAADSFSAESVRRRLLNTYRLMLSGG